MGYQFIILPVRAGKGDKMEERNTLRERALGHWARWAVDNWGKALIIAVLITVLMGFGMVRLKMEMTFYSILPAGSTQVRDLKQIVNDFSYASGVMVVVDGRSITDPVQAERTVKNTIDKISAEYTKDQYKPYITNVIGKVNTSFLSEHGLMLTKVKDLKRFQKTYSNLNLVPLITHINDDFEREYSGNENKLADDETQAVAQFRGLGELLKLIGSASEGKPVSDADLNEALDTYTLGDPYIMSNDNKMGLLIVQPTFTVNDVAILGPGINTLEAGAKKIASQEGIQAGLTGLTTIGRDEMQTSGQGLVLSTLIALILILGILIFSFRMFSVPLISGIPLILGIVWTTGLSGFFIQRLNVMTAMYLVALLGLGIDYAIHLLSGYIQERDGGRDFRAAVVNTFTKSGVGIITGALTTAAAFLTLTVAKTDLIKELGVVAGMGILSELIAMLLMLPPLLAMRESRLVKRGKTGHRVFKKIKIRSDAAGGIGRFIVKAPILIAVVMALAVSALGWKAPRVGVQDNILEMEAKGLESVKLNKEMVKEFGMAPDGLMIVSQDPDEVKKLSDKIDKLDSVKSVDSIADYYLTDKDYAERTPLLREVVHNLDRETVNPGVNTSDLQKQLQRLEDNLTELGDLSYMGNLDRLVNALGRITGINQDGAKTAQTSFDQIYSVFEKGIKPEGLAELEALQKSVYSNMDQRVRKMASTGKIDFNMLPSNIRDALISKDGKSYLISISPTQNPWKGTFRDVFTTQVGSVTPKATGMILAGDQLTQMAQKDGISAALLAVIAIFLILLADFRNLKLALVTMLPLLSSFLALFGIMALTGIKFDFINIIVVPLLIGIGIDDAVHINHRYLREGRGEMNKVIALTGTALLLTTLTTIFGFASFIPSPMRAMKSTGIVLSLAMAVAFINSVLFHPAVLIIINEKLGWNIKPWGDK